MRKYIIDAVLVLVVLILAGVTLYHSERLSTYQEYYRATENLLDTLEKYDNWVDRFDPEDYYNAVMKLQD